MHTHVRKLTLEYSCTKKIYSKRWRCIRKFNCSHFIISHKSYTHITINFSPLQSNSHFNSRYVNSILRDRERKEKKIIKKKLEWKSGKKREKKVPLKSVEHTLLTKTILNKLNVLMASSRYVLQFFLSSCGSINIYHHYAIGRAVSVIVVVAVGIFLCAPFFGTWRFFGRGASAALICLDA